MGLKDEINQGLQPHKSYDLDVLKSLAAVKLAKFEELKNRSSAAVSATICDVLGVVSTVLSLYAESSNPFKNLWRSLGTTHRTINRQGLLKRPGELGMHTFPGIKIISFLLWRS